MTMLTDDKTIPAFWNANGNPSIPDPMNDLNKLIPAYKVVDFVGFLEMSFYCKSVYEAGQVTMDSRIVLNSID